MEYVEWFRNYCKERNTFFGISACAMPQNWHELPDFVRYCNSHNITIYFNTVFFPTYCGFPSLEPQKLQHIIEVLSSETFPESSPIEVKNKHHFEDQIRQLKHLLKKKEKEMEMETDTSDPSRLENMADLKRFVADFIQDQSSWSDAVKRQKQATISANLDQLELKLGETFDYASVFKRWNLEMHNSTFIHNMLSEFETATTDDLVVRVNGAVPKTD
jgi:hypothetical protein